LLERGPGDKTMLARTLVLLMTALLLAGCYQSKTSLIADRELATPYASITYRETEDHDPPRTFVRRGKMYVDEVDDRLTLRLLPVATDWYVAELGGVDADDVQTFLYGYLNVDADAGSARLYAAVADSSAAVPAGLHPCGDVICIDSIDAYVTHAEKLVGDGSEPDTTYQFQTTP
jgi:hypothetical protein